MCIRDRVQDAGSPTVAQRVLAEVARDNAGHGSCGDIGVVVGATVDVATTGLELAASLAPILAPGVGAQGADAADVARRFAGGAGRVLVPVSRGVLSAGPDSAALASAVDGWTGRLRSALTP